MVPGKSADAVRRRYELLEEDVRNIEGGRVPLPQYNNSSDEAIDGFAAGSTGDDGNNAGLHPNGANGKKVWKL